jgi:hypothetical protein
MDTDPAYVKAFDAVYDLLKAIEALPGTDMRAVAVARTQFETGFLWSSSAIVKATLPRD